MSTTALSSSSSSYPVKYSSQDSFNVDCPRLSSAISSVTPSSSTTLTQQDDGSSSEIALLRQEIIHEAEAALRVKEAALELALRATMQRFVQTLLRWKPKGLPFLMAVRAGRAELVKVFLDCQPEKCLQVLSKGSNNVLHVAANCGDLETYNVLLKQAPHLETCRNDLGLTPREILLERCKTQPIDQALRSPAKPLSVKDELKFCCQLYRGLAKNDDGNTLMHVAVWEGAVDVVQLLLNNGWSQLEVDGRQREPLDIAAELGNLELVQTLVKGRTVFKNHPAVFAAWNGHKHILKFFAFQGVDLHKLTVRKDFHPDIEDIFRLSSSLDLLSICAWRGHTACVKMLSMRALTGEQVDALTLAASAGHVEVVNELIVSGDKRNSRGQMALHCAAQSGQPTVVKQLLSSYWAKRTINAMNGNGDTPLILAAERGHAVVVRLLLDAGAKYDISTKCLKTRSHFTSWRRKLVPALGVAAFHGHVEVMRILRDAGAKLPENLEFLCSTYQPESMEQLLEWNPELLFTQNDRNETLLHIAAWNNQVDTLKYLVSRFRAIPGTDCLLERNTDNQTLFEYALDMRLDAAAAALVEVGTPVTFKDMAKAGMLDLEQTIRAVGRRYNGSIPAELLSREDESEMGPLHNASIFGSVNVAKALLESGASTEARVRVTIASPQGWPEPSSDKLKGRSYTALQLACARGELEIVKVLVEGGASIHPDGVKSVEYINSKGNQKVRRNHHDEPAWIADQFGHKEIVSYLKKNGSDFEPSSCSIL
ncbi:MAG: ankyrin repeat domain-containing protein [Rhabdochlamydiaceae bacterium]|nr:ankyrin repeat domain-containing protein [Rhabdochlamydiaceae bacterium]